MADISYVDYVRIVDTDTRLIVLKLGAEWCPPCKAMSLVFSKLQVKYPDVLFYTIDIDKDPVSKQKFGFSAIPFFVFSKDGKTLKTSAGALTLEAMKNTIDSLLT